MDGEHLELRDSVGVAELAEAHRSCALAVELEDQPAESLRLAQRALDLVRDRRPVPGASAAEKRLDLTVLVERAQPVDVGGGRAPERDHRAVAAAASLRRRRLARGDRLPSATPTRISPRPPNAAAPKCSPRNTAP